MDRLSDEQQNILDKVKEGYNVVVDSVAGTGKTTLNLSIARELPKKKILQMTYNKSLRHEVKQKVHDLGFSNMEVHTYHSLAVRYYSPLANDDIELKRVTCANIPPVTPLPKIDIIVLDEKQDMTFLYYQFMIKVAKDMNHPFQLLILGDYMQGLYEFKGSDIRFLTMAEEIWKNHPLLRTQEFVKCTMKMSYRITNQMCSFVNDVLIGEERMKACRDGCRVQYIRNSRYNIEKIVCIEICKLFDEGVKPSDIFILGPSVKGERSNIRKLENMLVEKNIPCHVPMLETGKIDERVIEGKVVFSTFHCVKGRQRKYVFVVGFDNSYFKYYARMIPRDICPNTLYVACTRATHGLYLLENDTKREDRPLEFLHMNHIDMKQQDYIQFRGQHQTLFLDIEDKESTLPIKITPTELIKFIPESVLEDISVVLEKIFIKESPVLLDIDIPNIIETKAGYFEEVGDLNGIVIPCIYQDYLMQAFSNGEEKESILFELIDMNIENLSENKRGFLKEILDTLPEKIESISDYLYLANVNLAIQESLFFKVKQIQRDEYTWLTEDMVDRCKNRLRGTVGLDCQNTIPQMEEYIIYGSMEEQHIHMDQFLSAHFEGRKFRFTARVDMITENIVWELKCVSKLTVDHMLQLVIYAWLWRMRTRPSGVLETDQKDFKLFNIKTGELLRLDASMEELNTIMVALLKARYKELIPKTDEQFLEDCRSVMEKF